VGFEPLVDRAAPVSAQMALQVATLHAAIVKCSCSRSRRSPARVGSGESISRSASITFERAVLSRLIDDRQVKLL